MSVLYGPKVRRVWILVYIAYVKLLLRNSKSDTFLHRKQAILQASLQERPAFFKFYVGLLWTKNEKARELPPPRSTRPIVLLDICTVQNISSTRPGNVTLSKWDGAFEELKLKICILEIRISDLASLNILWYCSSYNANRCRILRQTLSRPLPFKSFPVNLYLTLYIISLLTALSGPQNRRR